LLITVKNRYLNNLLRILLNAISAFTIFIGIIIAIGYYVIYRATEAYILHEFNRSLFQTEALFLLIIGLGFPVRLNTHRLLPRKGVSN